MTVFDELTMRPRAGDASRGWNAGSRSRLVLTMSTTALLLVGANLATPLYPVLQERLGLGPFAVTVAFSSYVLALIAGLVLYGHWSDHIGRRTALVLSVLVGLAGEIVFATAGGLAGLVTGRVLQGAAVAMVTGASSAALRELLPHRPEWAGRFTLLASAGGVAAGPLLGGALGQLPHPTTTPFAVHCTMLIAVLVPLWTLHARPAIAPAPGPAAFKALRPRRLCLPPGVRTRFHQAAAVGFLSFALFGFSLSLAPGYFARTLGVGSPAGIGALAALVLIGSAAVQLVGRPRVQALPGALVGMALGTALIGVAGALPSLPLLLFATLFAGASQGVAFRTAFNELSVAVPAADNARVVSAVYVVTYLGSAVPVLGLGVLAGAVGVPSSVHWFAGTLAAACLVLAGTVRLRTRRGARRGQQAWADQQAAQPPRAPGSSPAAGDSFPGGAEQSSSWDDGVTGSEGAPAMSRARVHNFSISLDGFGTGEGLSQDAPFGHAGQRLHEWMMATRWWDPGGSGGVDDAFAREHGVGIGAEIMGAGKFGPPGWHEDPGWQGWWGPNPPFHTPVFVLTHSPRPSIEMEGGTTFHFLDASPAEALETARTAADGQDVRIGGGPTTVRDFLAAGLVDHLHVVVVPILLGRGVRLWEGLEGLEAGYRAEATSSPRGVTHVTFTRTSA